MYWKYTYYVPLFNYFLYHRPQQQHNTRLILTFKRILKKIIFKFHFPSSASLSFFLVPCMGSPDEGQSVWLEICVHLKAQHKSSFSSWYWYHHYDPLPNILLLSSLFCNCGRYPNESKEGRNKVGPHRHHPHHQNKMVWSWSIGPRKHIPLAHLISLSTCLAQSQSISKKKRSTRNIE